MGDRRLVALRAPILIIVVLALVGCVEREASESGCQSTTWFQDLDGDGFGDQIISVSQCVQPLGHVSQAGDCDDTDASRHPLASEECDFVDNDCDGFVDEDFEPSVWWYPDEDGDGYGAIYDVLVTACDPPDGLIEVGGDCDDEDPAIHPGADDSPCDGVDSDCDGIGWNEAAVLDGAETKTIGEALWNANDGSIVQVCPGIHDEKLYVPAGVVDLTFTSWSGDSSNTILDGMHKYTILFIPHDVEMTVSSLTFRHGAAEEWAPTGMSPTPVWVGGAILSLVSRDLTVEDCVFRSNEAIEKGGAIAYFIHSYWSSETPGVLTIDGSRFEENHAGYGGGAVCLHGANTSATVRISDSQFVGNSADAGGGAIMTGKASLFLSGCSFDSNRSQHSGGALYYNSRGEQLVRDCDFVGNSAETATAIKYSTSNGSDGEFHVSGSLFSGNVGGSTVRITQGPYDAAITSSSFIGNQSDDSAGILIAYSDEASTLKLRNVDFTQNSGGYVGVVDCHVSSGPLSIFLEESQIEGNSYNGVRLHSGCSLTATSSVFTQNVPLYGEGPCDVQTVFECHADLGSPQHVDCTGVGGCVVSY